jgi:predicted aldo/keto reductase-like oxidoreductase
LCKAAGFAAHVHCDQIKKIINAGKGKLGYVNLHYGFFSSYTNIDNQPAVLLAAEAGMGVYAISPSNQGGELHK